MNAARPSPTYVATPFVLTAGINRVCGEMCSIESLEKVEEEFKEEYDLCPFCSDEIVTTEKLLMFAIEKLGTTLKKLTKEYENG
jgi:hypothetical protein